MKEKFLLLRYMTDVPGLKWDGIKDRLGPLALQPPISLISYTWFSSLSSDLLINGFSLGLREPTCNMEMRD